MQLHRRHSFFDAFSHLYRRVGPAVHRLVCHPRIEFLKNEIFGLKLNKRSLITLIIILDTTFKIIRWQICEQNASDIRTSPDLCKRYFGKAYPGKSRFLSLGNDLKRIDGWRIPPLGQIHSGIWRCGEGRGGCEKQKHRSISKIIHFYWCSVYEIALQRAKAKFLERKNKSMLGYLPGGFALTGKI